MCRFGPVRHRAAPPRRARKGKCNVVPCRLPSLRARARCARATLCCGSLVCRGWCASPPLPPAPLPHVGAGLSVLCSRGKSIVGICSPLMPYRGAFPRLATAAEKVKCGGKPWLRGAWSVLRGLVPPPTHSSFGHLGRRRVAFFLPCGLVPRHNRRWFLLSGAARPLCYGALSVIGRVAAHSLFARAPRGAWRRKKNVLKNLRFFNILLKICIFAIETSDA